MKICTLALSQTVCSWSNLISSRSKELGIPVIGLVDSLDKSNLYNSDFAAIFECSQSAELKESLSQFDLVLVVSEGYLPSLQIKDIPVLPIFLGTKDILGMHFGSMKKFVEHASPQAQLINSLPNIQYRTIKWENPNFDAYPSFDCCCTLYRSSDFLQSVFRTSNLLAGVQSIEAMGCETLRLLNKFSYVCFEKSLVDKTEALYNFYCPELLNSKLKKVSKDLPEVSVIVPTKDRPDLLRRAVISIINQSHEDFEIIIINDGGKTPDKELLNLDARIRYLEHAESRGLPAARNTALKLARGNYITYLDDDDLIWPRHLELLTDKIKSCSSKLVYSKSARTWTLENNIVKRDTIYANKAFTLTQFILGNLIPVLNILHCRSLVDLAGDFDESLARVEDWDLWLRYAMKTEFVALDAYTCEYIYPVQGGSMSTSGLSAFMWHELLVRAKYTSMINADAERQYMVDRVTERDFIRLINNFAEAKNRNFSTMLKILAVKSIDLFMKQYEILTAAYPKFSSVLELIKQQVCASAEYAEEIRNYKTALLSDKLEKRVSIVMPLYNAVEYTRKTISSLYQNTDMSQVELILVDNASTDQTALFLKELEQKADLKIIRNIKNQNFSGGCNQGAVAASCQNILFLNSDVTLSAGWLDSMLEVLKDPSVGVVGNKQLFGFTGKLHHCGVVIDNECDAYHHLVSLDPEDPRAAYRKDYQIVTGSCLLIRKELFRLIDGFDIDYINGMEDCDLCLKVGQLGFRVVYTPESLIHHYVSQSPGRNAFEKQNSEKFKNRWKGIVKGDPNIFENKNVSAQSSYCRKSEKQRLGFVLNSALPSLISFVMDSLWAQINKSHDSYFAGFDKFKPILIDARSNKSKFDNIWWIRCSEDQDFEEFTEQQVSQFEIDKLLKIEQAASVLESNSATLGIRLDEAVPDFVNPFIDIYLDPPKKIESTADEQFKIIVCNKLDQISSEYLNLLTELTDQRVFYLVELADFTRTNDMVSYHREMAAENGKKLLFHKVPNQVDCMALVGALNYAEQILIMDDVAQCWKNIFSALGMSLNTATFLIRHMQLQEIAFKAPDIADYKKWAESFAALVKSKL